MKKKAWKLFLSVIIVSFISLDVEAISSESFDEDFSQAIFFSDKECEDEKQITDPSENTTVSSIGSPNDDIHVPEPLFFDLVRGLDSRKGDAEVNFLSSFNNKFNFAPEVEIAIKDGTAIEFELPTEDLRLSSYKLAFQQKIFSNKKAIGGFQAIYELNKNLNESEYFILPILGAKLNEHISVLSISGLAARFNKNHQIKPFIIANNNIFYEANNKTVFGLEINKNISFESEKKFEIRILPQIHRKIGQNYGCQLGAGVELISGKVYPVLALRLIKEFHLYNHKSYLKNKKVKDK